MEKILKSFLKRLTNISSSNRSVYLLRLYREQFFDLHRTDFLYKQPSFHLITQLLSGKKKIILCDELDSRDEKVNEISKNIRRIARREKLIFDESGARDLYVGWPFVKGKLADGSPVRCPLLFFPVSLLLEHGRWQIVQREEAEVMLNKSFVLAYAHFNHVHIPDDWIESSFEEFGRDPLTFRTGLYEFLKESPLEINFNQDLFADRLESFKEYKTGEFEEEHKNGELKLYPEAVLGIFPQAGSYLVPDYETMIAHNSYSGLDDFLHTRMRNEDRKWIREENNYHVFQSDASQEEALTTVKEGKSLVVQGPPGTGKSQLISNLITDFAARGKKVLLVCQKRAALDVVYDRLKTKGIEPFIGLVHDFRNDRTRLFEQIASQIGRIEEYQKQNNGMDTIYLERTFTQASRQIRNSQEELDNFKTALFQTGDFGISAKELYLTSDPNGAKVDLKAFASQFDLETSHHFERKINSFMLYGIRFLKPEYPWYHRVSFADYYQRDLNTILDVLEKIPLYQKQLQESASKKLSSSIKEYSLDFFLEHQQRAEKINSLIKEEDDYFLLLELQKEKTDKDWLTERRKKVLDCFDKTSPEVSLPSEKLELYKGKIEKYRKSRGNFFTALGWNLFSGDQTLLKKVLTENGLPFSPEGAVALSNKIMLRQKLEKERKSILKKGWTRSFPVRIDREELETWFDHYFNILEVKEIVQNSEELNLLTIHSENDYKVFYDNFHLLPILAEDVTANRRQWGRYLSPQMIGAIVQGQVAIPFLQEVLRRDFDQLIEFDKLQASLLGYEKQIMEVLIGHTGSTTEEEKTALFRNSIRLQWLEYLEEKYPSLLIVSNLRMDQSERALQEAIVEKMNVSRDILQLRLREGSYRKVEYNRLQNRITYRELFHQVSKKKKLWPIRKLISEYQEELLELIPCWMASPESVSALFPLREIFDLVIFDEASQCFAEQGLPAMYRGHQVVIAGDSKQLKPSDLYQTRWEDEEEDIADLEIDSLLDLSSKYLPSVQLTGHYRSKNLDLIDFSNRHFYRNSLQLMPYFSEINSPEPSIHYIPVKGLWEHNTNPEEALQVATLALDLLEKRKGKSIGIVTFNFRQAQLITDLIDRLSTEKQVLIPESFFVKNIENVQGDEKDIILFSIGYAPDHRGKFTMQFGSLNQEGGENRLNVAVTRAREKIYVVASIMPQQLQVEESLHEGPRLLKKYLEYAWEVSEGLYRPSPLEDDRQSREWYLSKKLIRQRKGMNYQFCEELPFADITVKNHEKYYALIYTDDHSYFNARNSKELHAYKPMELKEKGWMSKRFFSRQYWLKQNGDPDLI